MASQLKNKNMAIQKEIWTQFIAENLFKNNEFLRAAFSHDEYVLAGKVVHIPQSGALVGVKKNRSSVPASITQRSDTEVTYSLDEFTTDPVYIPDAEKVELSYDKISSVLTDIMGALRQTTADWILYHWGPTAAANFIRTTGDSVAAHLDGATGNRKQIELDNLKAAKLALDKQNAPMEKRYAIMSANLLDQFTDGLTASQYRDFSAAYDAARGVVGKLFGFEIFQRSDVLRYNNAGTPAKKDPDAASATTDNDAVICWQQNALARAMGEIKMFENVNDPTYYGDIYSGLVRMSGRIRRNDQVGVVSIIQASA